MDYKPGDVFQINEKHSGHRTGWIGCFVLAEQVKSWGIKGFVAWPENHFKQSKAHIRLEWHEIDFIGHATMVPEDGAA